MSYGRDPLSVEYDPAVRAILVYAIRAHKQGRAATAWVHSPAREFRQLTARGDVRTASERAFTRSAYWQVTKNVPKDASGYLQPYWSLKMTWGKLENHGGRYGRRVSLRLYKYGSGQRKVKRNPGTSYVERPSLRSGAAGSGQQRFPA